MATLLINAELSNPPSTVGSFRDITLYSSAILKVEVVIECPNDSKDMYWHWLRNHGAMDYIKEIVVEDDELDFYRIDNKLRRPKTIIVVDKIVPENSWNILQSISFLSFL
jgi:hypothetical protein